jgi:hypothetical protein
MAHTLVCVGGSSGSLNRSWNSPYLVRTQPEPGESSQVRESRPRSMGQPPPTDKGIGG